MCMSVDHDLGFATCVLMLVYCLDVFGCRLNVVWSQVIVTKPRLLLSV